MLFLPLGLCSSSLLYPSSFQQLAKPTSPLSTQKSTLLETLCRLEQTLHRLGMAYVRERMELIRIKLFGPLVVIAIVVAVFSWKCAADVLEMRSMVLDIKICRHSVASEVGSSHRLKIIVVHIEARQVIKVNKFKHWYTPRRRDILVLLGEVNVVSIKGCVSEFNDLVPALMRALKERAGVFAPLMLQFNASLVIVVTDDEGSARPK